MRRSLYGLAALLLLMLGLAGCLLTGFDGDPFERMAIEWMRVHHACALAFDGPMSPQLGPQPRSR